MHSGTDQTAPETPPKTLSLPTCLDTLTAPRTRIQN
jgi:hypothetical protein